MDGRKREHKACAFEVEAVAVQALCLLASQSQAGRKNIYLSPNLQ